MNSFFPFIHKIEKTKKQEEMQPLYIDLEPPPPQEKIKEDEDKDPGFIIYEF